MPFDGFVTKCVAEELNAILAGGRIDKIRQPERDEIHITIRSNGKNHRLLISANAATPRVYLTAGASENPESAPMFCMILRKHIGGGRIVGICAKGLERVVEIAVESPDELGDISVKTLIAEIMGKHSNVILINQDRRIIDALVHVDQDMSSVREVMPARVYTPPPPQDKIIPSPGALDAIIKAVEDKCESRPMEKISPALLDTIMGASPLFCRELCMKAGIGDRTPLALIGGGELGALRDALAAVLDDAYSGKYSPCVVYRDPPAADGAGSLYGASGLNGAGGINDAGSLYGGFEEGRALLDFYCWRVLSSGAGICAFGTMSEAADAFYEGRARAASLAQRKAWLLRLVSGQIARCSKKLAIQNESMREAANRDIYKLYGELIIANIHQIKQGERSVRLMNYYAAGGGSGADSGSGAGDCSVADSAYGADGAYGIDGFVTVELDDALTPQANAQAYFKKYRKAASTWKNAELQAAETGRELEYLESVLQELEMCQSRQEIDEIRQELASQKYIADAQSDRAVQRVGKRGLRKGGNRHGGAGNSEAQKGGARQGNVKSGGTRQGSLHNGGKHRDQSAGARRGEQLSHPHIFTSSDGLEIHVGKNNRQNDQLTMKTASSNDIWLHARNTPGSHVIIKKQLGDVPQGTLLEAASLAAYFSKARMSGNVGVDYTAVRHVRKPSGAKPGMVIYDNQRTLNVTPDEALLMRLSDNRMPQRLSDNRMPQRLSESKMPPSPPRKSQNEVQN